ncbi:hypothetical protein M446_5931 [Methylobacterium sp. 4-46]|uniref:hypothetical protein n=1 Tax=unclassified Methylobacterium TaxID=2615210 RepID=UPI000165CB2A|nr:MULTISPECIES: hypothetical protein [Methylobacterium]ACA20212.1 hypothetical protein M446_5931 [Methylobacterium sp. 4-46]WFT79392.1 hypothetical protein QA634_29950 [Methylobacterium nodulans]
MTKRKDGQIFGRHKKTRGRKPVKTLPATWQARRRVLTAGEISDEYHGHPGPGANDNMKLYSRKRLYCVPVAADEAALPCA